MTVEQYAQLIELLGGVTTIGIMGLAGFVLFKLVIYLSTTGAIVYLVKLAISSMKDHLDKRKDVELELATAAPPPEPDQIIKDICLGKGTYNDLHNALLMTVRHVEDRRNARLDAASVNRINMGNSRSRYFHDSDMEWLKKAIHNQMNADIEEFNKKQGTA